MSLYLQNDTRYGHSYNARRIWRYTRSLVSDVNSNDFECFWVTAECSTTWSLVVTDVELLDNCHFSSASGSLNYFCTKIITIYFIYQVCFWNRITRIENPISETKFTWVISRVTVRVRVSRFTAVTDLIVMRAVSAIAELLAARCVCVARTKMSVRLTITRRYCVETAKHIIKLFHPYFHTILVFFVPNLMAIFDWNPRTGASNSGVWKNREFWHIACDLSIGVISNDLEWLNARPLCDSWASCSWSNTIVWVAYMWR